MEILVTNDDGIGSKGLVSLVIVAKHFGHVTVVAPEEQCSAVSQKITIRKSIQVYEAPFFGNDVTAYMVAGTPADCVKVGIAYVLRHNPDYVFSGINHGWNVGFDIAYSGTIGACFESLMKGVPAIAFSQDTPSDQTERYCRSVVSEILQKERLTDGIWNVNLPECSKDEYKGIAWNTVIDKTYYCEDKYSIHKKDGVVELDPTSMFHTEKSNTEKITDRDAVLNGYLSAGIVKCNVLL